MGGALLGLGISALNKGQTSMPDLSAANINYQDTVGKLPTVPEAPTTPTEDGSKKSDAMLAAEEAERKRRAQEAEANKTNHTTGLGVTSSANVDRKTLLG